MSGALPSIRTPRLTLEPLRPATVAAMLEVERAIEQGRAQPRSDGVLQARLSRWGSMVRAARSGGTWVVVNSGRLVGRVALDRHDGGSGWLSYALTPTARGQGFATEAAEAAIAWAFGANDVCNIRAVVRPANTASIAVLRRLGMTLHPDSDAANSVFVLRSPHTA